MIDAYNIDSGIIFISGKGGGSDDINTLKLGWWLAYTVSRNPSKPFNPVNQFYIKCTFYNIIQCPYAAQSINAFLAISS